MSKREDDLNAAAMRMIRVMRNHWRIIKHNLPVYWRRGRLTYRVKI